MASTYNLATFTFSTAMSKNSDSALKMVRQRVSGLCADIAAHERLPPTVDAPVPVF